MGGPGPVTRDGARRAAQHELAKTIYHRPGDPWPVRAVRAAGHGINYVLDRTVSHAGSGSFGAVLVVAAIVVIAVLIIVRVGVPRRARTGDGVVFGADPIRSAMEHRALAEAAADGGDWSTAVVERMRAVARELEERSVVDERPGRTASEVATAAGEALPVAAHAISAAADTFNRIAYGDDPARPEDVDVVARADDVVRRTARRKAVAQ